MADDGRTVGFPPRSVRVSLVTDDRLLAGALHHLIGAEPSMTLVQCCDFARICGECHVLLLDCRVEGAMTGCSAFARGTGPRVIFVGAPDDDEWALESITAGARGIIVRSARPEDVISAIRVVDSGLIWARRRVVSAFIDRVTGVARPRGPLDHRLSVREREIFRHAAAGLGNKELASLLAISEATVKVHLTHIFQKLGVRGRGELAAAYHGLIAPGEAEGPLLRARD